MTDPGRDQRILGVVRALARGEVVSYGDVAIDAGYPGRARLVGHLLARHESEELAWWRVVGADGRLVPGLEAEQAAILRAEGAVVVGGRVRSSPSGRFRQRERSAGRTPAEGC